MSVSIYAFCRKERISKQQTTIVQLCVTINRKRRYVSTGIKIPVSEWNFENQEPNLENQAIKFQIYEQIESLNKQIRRLEALDMEISFDNLLPEKHKIPNCTIVDYFIGNIELMESAGKIGSASKHRVTLSLLQQSKIGNMRFDELNTSFLRKFEQFLCQRGNGPNSIATKISVFKSVYNKALRDKVFICKENPFATYKAAYKSVPTQKRAIKKEDVLRLMNLPMMVTNTPYAELSRDLFLFSYFSAGINFKDIAMLRYGDLIDGRIYYSRKKTGKKMNCRLIPQAQTIIDKYIHSDKTDDDYIFPILDRHTHKTSVQIANRLHKVLAHINRELNNWGIRLGLKIKLTTYVARHTYATVLKRSGVNIAIISESLGHSDISTTQIYLDSFENTQIDEAMKNLV